ncbi:hypothetical protein, partial [Beijerinckia sp. L45]|uniref:hypothetical protein n=1 Tax=Beijerinckia sp. L45 TaxID=1641855 RepID=UPI001AED8C4A
MLPIAPCAPMSAESAFLLLRPPVTTGSAASDGALEERTVNGAGREQSKARAGSRRAITHVEQHLAAAHRVGERL